MSKVYHGSIEEVKSPEIRQPNRSLDYGSGFYTTTSYEQAKKWVERRMKDKGVSVGYVNVYELDDNVIKRYEITLLQETNRGMGEFRNEKSYREGVLPRLRHCVWSCGR